MLIIVPRKDIQDALHCICRCTLAKKYRYQIEKDVKNVFDFLRLGDVGVQHYPERHPDSSNKADAQSSNHKLQLQWCLVILLCSMTTIMTQNM